MRSTMLMTVLGTMFLAAALGFPWTREASSQADISGGKAAPPVFVWEAMTTRNGPALLRAKVPGGWLVAVDPQQGGGMTFYADPLDKWDGSTVPPLPKLPGAR